MHLLTNEYLGEDEKFEENFKNMKVRTFKFLHSRQYFPHCGNQWGKNIDKLLLTLIQFSSFQIFSYLSGDTSEQKQPNYVRVSQACLPLIHIGWLFHAEKLKLEALECLEVVNRFAVGGECNRGFYNKLLLIFLPEKNVQ